MHQRFRLVRLTRMPHVSGPALDPEAYVCELVCERRSDSPSRAGTGWDCVTRSVAQVSASPLHVAERLEELGQRDPEGRGHTFQRAHTYVALAALDAADVVAVQVGSGSKLLLGEAGSEAQLANTGPDPLRQLIWHAEIVTSCTR